MEDELNGANDFEVLLKRGGGVAEDIVASLDGTLVVGAPGLDVGGAAVGAAEGLDWEVGVVLEGVGGFVAGLLERECAVAAGGVGASTGVQVPGLPVGAGQGSLVLVLPLVDAHDEEAKRRLIPAGFAVALEPAVEPGAFEAVDVDD